MRITKISRMRNCRVFHDFMWPAELHAFGDFNLIYGWNGTGKSTISHIFRCLERRDLVSDGDVRLVVDGVSHLGSEFPSFQPSGADIKVFNQEFVKASVFRTNDDDNEMDPIYVVGTTGVDTQQQIDTLQADLEAENTKLTMAQARESSAKSGLDRHSPARAKEIKDNLGGRDDPIYRNYDRRSYEERADRMLRDGDATDHQLLDADKDQLGELQRERPKDKIEPPSYESTRVATLSLRVQQLLERTVAPAGAIQALLHDPVLTTWIEQGRQLHADDASGNCLYCTQQIPQERIEAIEQHFNDEVQRLNNAVDAAIDDLESKATGIDRLRSGWWNSAVFFTNLRESYESAQDSADSYLTAVRTHIDDLIASLRKKRATPHERIPMPTLTAGVNESAMELVVDVVRDHNRQCDEFDERVKSARQRLEADAVAASLPEYRELVNARDQAAQDQHNANAEIRSISAEIATLQQQMRNHRLPAEELNRDLHDYLGHSQIQLAVRAHGYVIRRDGQIARDLSEGERTAIALLYFLRSLEADEFDLRKGVVVLDDPVSSLDTNALYTALGFIRARTSDAGQLFILTHNWTFFREVKNWFSNVPGQRKRKRDRTQKPAKFYMLQSSFRDGRHTSKISRLDPLLLDHESDYTYLFSRIHRAATEPTYSLEASYPLPNMMRRFLEAFFAFKQPGTESLRSKLDKVDDFDEAKKMQILTFANSFSHNQIVDLPEHDSSILSESASVARHVLDLVGKEDAAHLAGLEKELKRATESAGAE